MRNAINPKRASAMRLWRRVRHVRLSSQRNQVSTTSQGLDMTTVLESDVTTVLERTWRPCAIPETGAVLPSKLRWSCLVRLCSAIAVLGPGAHAVWQDAAEVTTDRTVIYADIIARRTPIDGAAKKDIRRVGDYVDRGDVIAEVTNSRVDDRGRPPRRRETGTRRCPDDRGAGDRPPRGSPTLAVLADLTGRTPA